MRIQCNSEHELRATIREARSLLLEAGQNRIRYYWGNLLHMTRVLIAATVANTIRGFLLPHARHMRSLGWQVDAAARGISSCSTCIESLDSVWDVEWSRNPFDLRSVMQAAGTIRELVQKRSYDIVHVHTPVAAFVTRYALRRMREHGGPAVIYTAHGFHFHPLGQPVKNATFLGLEKLAGRWTDCLVVINQEDQDAALRHRVVQPDRLRRIHGIGIDTQHYSPASVNDEQIALVRREFHIPDDVPVFLMVAAFLPGKRHRHAIEAFALLRKRCDACLVFAGDGPRAALLRQLAERLGIGDRVIFAGTRDDVPVLMRASTATVLTSMREGVSRSVMESLSLETPAIGTSIRGVKELLEDNCGVLVPVGDAQALADAMLWVIDHPEECRTMAVRGRLKMHGSYSIETVIREQMGIYQDVLAARGSSADRHQTTVPPRDR